MQDDRNIPDGFTEFPEEERVRDGPMRREILTMLVEALEKQGYPGISSRSIADDPAHRDAALDMLGDCRPLPVIKDLMQDIESGRFSGE